MKKTGEKGKKKHVKLTQKFPRNLVPLPTSRGGLPYETDGDARRLAYGCKFWILVSLRVFRAKRQYFKVPRSRLGFREETQNYAKRNRSQIVFLVVMFTALPL